MPDERPGDYRLCYRGITFILSSPSDVDVTANESGLMSGTATPISIGGASNITLTDTVMSEFEEKLTVKRIYVFLGQNVDEAK